MSSAPDNVLSLVSFLVTNFFDVSVIILALNAMSKERENQGNATAATEMKLEATQMETVVEECLASTSKAVKKKGKMKSVRIETDDEYVKCSLFGVRIHLY